MSKWQYLKFQKLYFIRNNSGLRLSSKDESSFKELKPDIQWELCLCWYVHSYLVSCTGKEGVSFSWLGNTFRRKNFAMNFKKDITWFSKRWLRGKWKKARDLRICTWNVMLQYRPRALKMLFGHLHKYNADAAAVKYVRWRGPQY